MRVGLVNAPLLSAVCHHGVGHQMPPGVLMVGGVAVWGADVAMVAHVGSTQAHPCCLRTMAALKAALPGIVTAYGGVHPTYHAAGLSQSSN